MQNKLQAVFTQEELEFKVQASGKNGDSLWVLVATYVQARAIQERLDSCFGFDGWSVAYRETPSGVICRLKVFYEGREIIKEDGAELTGKIGDANALKGGCSGALKRVASSGLGIGRYLYTLPKMYAKKTQKAKPANTDGWHNSKLKSGEYIWWQEPDLPHWAYSNECDKQPLVPLITEQEVIKEPLKIEEDKKVITPSIASHLKWPLGKLKGTSLGIVFKRDPGQIKYLYENSYEGKFEDIKNAIEIIEAATPEKLKWRSRVS